MKNITNIKSIFTFLFTVFSSIISLYGQTNDTDKSALEGVIIEKYYISDSKDEADTVGGALPKGSITYRIFIDLKQDYTLQLVYGSEAHPLRLETTTTFYNNKSTMALTGYNVNNTKINDDNYLLDSWITMNSATTNHAGILKADDKDGSIIKRSSLINADGLTDGNLPLFKPFNIDMNFFNDSKKASRFYTTNGGWAAVSGVKPGCKGPTSENRILVAQLTTNGKLSFELNVQVGTPTGGMLKFVAKNAEGSEMKNSSLTNEK